MSQSVAVLGSNVVPLQYKVPVPGTLTALSASGTFDGTSSAAFQPCLSFYDSDGNLLVRATAPVVAAGESAEVSWFPRVGGSGGGDGWKFKTDNEGGWGLVVANETGPNGYGLQFDTGSSAVPIGLTGDGGLTVNTAGVVSIEGDSGIVMNPGGNNLNLSGYRIVNGAAGINPTDFATVEQLGAGGGVTDLDGITGSVNLVAGTNVSIVDNSPSAGDITISAAGGGGSGGIVQAATVSRTAGDLTTSSTSFVAATGLSLSMGTGAHRCLIIFSASGHSSSGNNVCVDVAVDGVRQGQTFGLTLIQSPLPDLPNAPMNFTILTAPLSAATHTFEIQWRVDAHSGTMFASASVTPAIMTVIELGI